MATNKKDRLRTKRRTLRVRSRVRRDNALPRVSIFRSLKHMYAQIIDDATHATLVSCSSLELKDVSGDKRVVAKAVGFELAKRAKEKGIEKAKFDRGPFLYHGRVEAVAQGLRDGDMRL